jgi:hypothetical protein
MIELFFFFPPGLSNCLKKSSNGEPGGNEGICLDLSSITVVVEILTTEGLSFSARSAKLSGALLACDTFTAKNMTKVLITKAQLSFLIKDITTP